MKRKPNGSGRWGAYGDTSAHCPVTQIFNLPYRRFSIGRRSDGFGFRRALRRSDGQQVENLRYGRFKICVTGAVRGRPGWLFSLRGTGSCDTVLGFMCILRFRLSKSVLFLMGLLAVAPAGHGEATNPATWHFKQEFLPVLVQSVPRLLKSQDQATGRFGSGIWIPADQSAIYVLAAAWALKDTQNPYYHGPKLLAAIMRGGDVLAETQDKSGQWVFRKKDNSTWGMHFNPWVYSRWVRAYSLIRDAMPPERRAKWEKALELGFTGIEKHELSHVHNIPTHQAMGLYIAGQALKHPEWCARASAFLAQVAEQQDPNGFWSEHLGPVVNYNHVYVDALGTYYGLTHDTNVLAAVQRAARFHANFTYPDGSNIETVDERNPYSKRFGLPNVGFTFSAEGRGYLRQQWLRLEETQRLAGADTVASMLLYGEEGAMTPPPGLSRNATFVTADGSAAVIRKGSWCACLSAYAGPLSTSRWIEDRQNVVSLFHEKTGLILGGGNTKLQPLWSTFTVGDTSLLKHRPGDENPNFSPPAGLLHVPSKARLEGQGQELRLEYGETQCSVALDLSEQNRARLSYSALPNANSPVEAHLTFLPAFGKKWSTASGKGGRIGAKPFKLTAAEAGAWFEHNGWRVELPQDSSLRWPVLPHNPYRKDGGAEPGEGRIVLTVPFATNRQTQGVVVSVRE